jgi:hypothetical protein
MGNGLTKKRLKFPGTKYQGTWAEPEKGETQKRGRGGARVGEGPSEQRRRGLSEAGLGGARVEKEPGHNLARIGRARAENGLEDPQGRSLGRGELTVPLRAWW